ncbi:unnamed protein product [Protopolystoma xenopodis]|uniref:Homeobox domain-containing protein n=1 Tax=Protopolystoma xenopodis TaxID=117903 RepID=A0A448WD75_9PLAT|nr:unnamed protein product [Protopolystoma xenopodis]
MYLSFVNWSFSLGRQVITWFQNRRAKMKREAEELERDLLAAKRGQRSESAVDSLLDEGDLATDLEEDIDDEEGQIGENGIEDVDVVDTDVDANDCISSRICILRKESEETCFGLVNLAGDDARVALASFEAAEEIGSSRSTSSLSQVERLHCDSPS